MERLLFECALRSTLIAVAAVIVLSAMRIRNVAARHSTWTSVLLFMLGLPLLVAAGRPIPLRVLPAIRQNAEHVIPSFAGRVFFTAPQFSPALPESSPGDTKSGRLAWTQWIEGIYVLGVAVLLLRLITGMIGANRLQRRARLVDG